MINYDSIKHVRGESQFVDDFIPFEKILYGYVFTSPIAHGIIKKLDIKEALKFPGVKYIFTFKDIPGENQVGGIVQDEVLFAEDKVEFVGQPIAFVVAEDFLSAKRAAKKIRVEIEELEPIFDPRLAFEKGLLIIPPRIFSLGNVDEAWQQCDFVIEGQVESGGQEHLYLETQGSIAFPVDKESVKIFSSTQNPTHVQKIAAHVLGIPMNKVEVDVLRLGGGFGGKEDQATHWAVMTALAAKKLNTAVKLILPRQEDMRMTGKRHPYSSDFKIGLNKEGKILAYEVTFYQNAGAAADLSPAILERTLFHTTNTYYIPNVKATAYSCKTNLPPNTAFRGFGGPQAMFVMESALFKASQVTGIDYHKLQKINLLNEGDEFPYGQKAFNCRAKLCYDTLEKKYDVEKVKLEIDEFNSKSKFVKKAYSIMPICFGISFTSTYLNQASALVHIYVDGSVGISTAAVEMGQGVNAKLLQIASKMFSISPEKIKIESTNTTRIANTSPTAASKAADLNGFALMEACELILNRLKKFAAQRLNVSDESKIKFENEWVFVDNVKTDLNWGNLIKQAYLNRINLSAHAHHATPDVYFDREISKGKPFAYHVYGTALIEVTVDCLRGTYKIDSVKVVHDLGDSIHPVVDLGQVEGGIVQGIGWMTVEEVIYNDKGKLITDALSTYKVPDIYFAPEKIEVQFLENASNPFGPFKSKAVGEPPFMYGIGAFFAILKAMLTFNPEMEIQFKAPMTNERVLMSIYSGIKEKVSNHIHI
ncbi:MAG: molybdopterin-dependent oxidoreductase [Ignavibacteria bacterium]|jgi:xanthine dehydrogenase large subunit|nr:molybdopterin-dependent oxidoreductase [Ignavibacteria bacterium]MDH7526613.1 molybdopterin-dependent oxidoreductase [Ignavibacteria bacterium]